MVCFGCKVMVPVLPVLATEVVVTGVEAEAVGFELPLFETTITSPILRPPSFLEGFN